MSRTGLTGPQSVFYDKTVKTAQALYAVGRHTPTSNELKLARNMKRAGASIREVHEALGWGCPLHVTRYRLRKFGIRFLASRARRGQETGLPKSEHGVNMRAYRPRGSQ